MKNKYCLIVLLILIFDQMTKWMARVHLGSGPRVDLIQGYLRFSCESNTGVAFGLFHDIDSVWKPYILAGLAIVAVLVIWMYARHISGDRKLLHWALAITMGGILGNFVDRIVRGYVVDFIEFHIHETFYWPTFNIADSAITIGIAILLLDTLKNPAPRSTAEQSTGDNKA